MPQITTHLTGEIMFFNDPLKMRIKFSVVIPKDKHWHGGDGGEAHTDLYIDDLINTLYRY